MSHQALSLTGDEPRFSPSSYLSYKLVPEVWYENLTTLRLLYGVALLILLALFLPRYGYEPPLFWSVAGSSLYLIGWLVDTTSTWLCLRLVPRFEARGLVFPIIETNPILGKRPTLSELLFGYTAMFAVFATIASWFFPAAGIAGSTVQLGVGLNNLRQHKRLKLQLSLYDEVEKRRGV